MKVLMFGWEFPPFNSGGLGVACFGLTRALTRLGVDVSFVLPKKIGISKSHCNLLFADIGTVYEVDALLSPYLTSEGYVRALPDSGAGIYGRTLLDEVKRYALRARDIAKKENFNVIHAHDWLSFPAGIAAQEAKNKPLFAHVHATEFDRTGGNGINKAVYDIEREGMRRAEKVITVSNFTKGLVVNKYGVAPSKVEVVHNGIDREDYAGGPSVPESIKKLKEDGNKIVLFVGRLTLQKGPDYFVKVAEKILEHNNNVYFVVAGSGDMETKMIDEVAGRGIASRFIFTGFLRGAELNQIYQSADLYIMPSVSEPFGITPLESMINGTPVLLSRQAGVAETVAHILRADFWDIDDMVDKSLSVLNYPSLHETLRQNGTDEVHRIDWKRAGEKCVKLYENAMQAYA